MSYRRSSQIGVGQRKGGDSAEYQGGAFGATDGESPPVPVFYPPQSLKPPMRRLIRKSWSLYRPLCGGLGDPLGKLRQPVEDLGRGAPDRVGAVIEEVDLVLRPQECGFGAPVPVDLRKSREGRFEDLR